MPTNPILAPLGDMTILVGQCLGKMSWDNIDLEMVPRGAELTTSITSSILAQVGQLRSPSTFMQRVYNVDEVVIC